MVDPRDAPMSPAVHTAVEPTPKNAAGFVKPNAKPASDSTVLPVDLPNVTPP